MHAKMELFIIIAKLISSMKISIIITTVQHKGISCTIHNTHVLILSMYMCIYYTCTIHVHVYMSIIQGTCTSIQRTYTWIRYLIVININ